MKSEKEKMLAGELYDPLDPLLAAERRGSRGLSREGALRGGPDGG